MLKTNLEKKYISSFNGLKTLALIFVIAYHLESSYVPGAILSVVIFFVITGFFATTHIVSELSKNNEFDFKKYYLSRFLKIYLPLLVFLLTIMLWTYFIQTDVFPSVYKNIIWNVLPVNNIVQIYENLSYFENWANFSPFTHLWALSVEIQFYILFPLIMVPLYKKFSIRKVLIFLSLITLSSVAYMWFKFNPNIDPSYIYYSTFGRLFSFTIGSSTVFLNLILQGDETSFSNKVNQSSFSPRILNFLKNKLNNIKNNKILDLSLFLIFIFLLIYPMFIFSYEFPFIYRGGMFIYSMILSLFIIFIYDDRYSFILNRPIFKFLCERSYSLYLWQYGLMILMNNWFAHIKISTLNKILIHIFVLLIIGELSYRLFEKNQLLLFLSNKNIFPCLTTLAQKIKSNSLRIYQGFFALFLLIFIFLFLSYADISKFQTDNIEAILNLTAEEASGEETHLNNTDTDEVYSVSDDNLAFEKKIDVSKIFSEENLILLNNSIRIKNKEAEFDEESQIKSNIESDSRNNNNIKENTKDKKDNLNSPDLSRLDRIRTDIEKQSKLHNLKKGTINLSDTIDISILNSNISFKSNVDFDEEIPLLIELASPRWAGKEPFVTIVGDSILVLLKNDLMKRLENTYIDGKVSRQLYKSLDLLRELKSNKKIGDVLVIILGSNGVFREKDLDYILEISGSRPLFFVNVIIPDPWEEKVNKSLASFASKHRNVHIIDWYSYGKEKPEWFYKDKAHPNVNGAKIMADFIVKNLKEKLYF